MTTSSPSSPWPLEVARRCARCPSRSRAGGADLDVGDAGERRAELARVRRLALGDARQHVVVERLHDAQQPDARAGGRRRLSAVRRRSGSGRRAHRCPLGSSGMGSPSARARCTVRAASSHITAALIASRGPGPRVNTPWLRISTAGERWPASVSTTPRPISSSPIRANGPIGDLAAELVGHRGEHARDRLAARRPRGGVGAVGVRDAADVGHAGGRRSRGWRRRWTGARSPSTSPPCRSQTTIASGVSSA